MITNSDLDLISREALDALAAPAAPVPTPVPVPVAPSPGAPADDGRDDGPRDDM